MRRKRRFTWLPTLGSANPAFGEAHTLSGRLLNLVVFRNITPGTAGQINTFVIPVVPDDPIDPSKANAVEGGLQLSLGNEWFLERIVGKLFLGIQVAETNPPAVLVGAGFFVARCNDEDSGGGRDTAIGSASVAERNPNYSPLHGDTIREPWLWRRTWLLGGTPQTTAGAGLTFFPTNNGFAGSALDGPHIDAKSVRRIGNDERLFFAVSTAALTGSAAQTVDGVLDAYLDIRLLGALRKARGKSSF